MTNDLEKRLGAHGRGGVKYTRGRLPVEVAHTERARDRGDALRKEAAWKRLTRAQKLAKVAAAVLSAKDVEAPRRRVRARSRRLLRNEQ